jgi:transposase InsO family protein
VTPTTDNGTQFTSSRFLETLGRLGITHRRTAYHHPEGNSYIERFHRSLKEEEVSTVEHFTCNASKQAEEVVTFECPPSDGATGSNPPFGVGPEKRRRFNWSTQHHLIS